uniref:SERPIN domain-containing protein n=1 Tax=Caenorhabditis tropicalis TaxID=1561998 RepID=A0A1I7USE1_9PELO
MVNLITVLVLFCSFGTAYANALNKPSDESNARLNISTTTVSNNDHKSIPTLPYDSVMALENKQFMGLISIQFEALAVAKRTGNKKFIDLFAEPGTGLKLNKFQLSPKQL